MADHPADRSGSDLETAFPLTPEERALLNAAPFPNNPENWIWFAAKVIDALLESYASGQMDLRETLKTMRACALGCPAGYRVSALGMLAERALKITPPNTRTQKYPHALQRLAAGLVEYLREDRSDDKLDTILAVAIAWLVAVGICDKDHPIAPGTLRNWYLEQKKAVGDPIVRGRPAHRQ